MKRLLVLFVPFCVLMILSCPSPRCRVYGHGVVYLKILDENGNVLSYDDAKHFKVTHSGSYEDRDSLLVINEEDALVYELGRVDLEYRDCKRLKNIDGFTDEEIIKSLDGAGFFSIKDIRKDSAGKASPVYKTIANLSYKDCYKSFERTKLQPTSYSGKPSCIYYCEMSLQLK